jgi:hypothetical protein
LPHLRDVDIHWASETLFARDGDWAQSDDVFRFAPPEADLFLAMDADTFPVDALEPILERVLAAQTIAGVIAHYPPFPMNPGGPVASNHEAWRRLALGLTDVPLEFAFTHTLIGADVPVEHRETPFYLNFGVVFFPKGAFETVAPTYLAIRPRLVDRLPSPDFSGQAALTLAISSKGARTLALPMRYNFPNDPSAEEMYPTELENATVFHYLRTDAFDRHQIFVSAEHYEQFLGLSLNGVNQRFQEAVRAIVGERYPFA